MNTLIEWQESNLKIIGMNKQTIQNLNKMENVIYLG